jgi:shikimate kinase
MAGSGKSYWSIRLAELGFSRFCCDDLIATRLTSDLMQADGTTMGLGEWMGFPFEPHYQEREIRYLEHEIDVLSKILLDLEESETSSKEKIVVDTTGSVIYTGNEVLRRLGRSTTVIHLSTPAEVKEQMLQVYVAQPRPVLWRDVFGQEPEETNEEALARCYPILLSTRERLYEQYADVTISYYSRNKKGFGVNDFLDEIRAAIS